MGLLLRVVFGAVAVWVATLIVPGVEVGGDTTTERIVTLLIVAAVFALVNVVIKPVVTVLALPFYLLTLGLLALVVNALLFWLTAWVAEQLDVAFTVEGFWAALFGALVVSIVSVGLNSLARD